MVLMEANTMQENTQVIGYRVFTGYDQCTFIDYEGSPTSYETKPCTKAEAYGRIAKFLSRNYDAQVPIVVPVTRPLTPIECGARELGSLLTSLCTRHGIDLGLTLEQVERKIAKELVEFGAFPGTR